MSLKAEWHATSGILSLDRLSTLFSLRSVDELSANGPMLFALLEMMQSQSDGFMPPQPTREQQCEQGSVAFSFQSLAIGCLQKRTALVRR